MARLTTWQTFVKRHHGNMTAASAAYRGQHASTPRRKSSRSSKSRRIETKYRALQNDAERFFGSIIDDKKEFVKLIQLIQNFEKVQEEAVTSTPEFNLMDVSTWGVEKIVPIEDVNDAICFAAKEVSKENLYDYRIKAFLETPIFKQIKILKEKLENEIRSITDNKLKDPKINQRDNLIKFADFLFGFFTSDWNNRLISKCSPKLYSPFSTADEMMLTKWSYTPKKKYNQQRTFGFSDPTHRNL